MREKGESQGMKKSVGEREKREGKRRDSMRLVEGVRGKKE